MIIYTFGVNKLSREGSINTETWHKSKSMIFFQFWVPTYEYNKRNSVDKFKNVGLWKILLEVLQSQRDKLSLPQDRWSKLSGIETAFLQIINDLSSFRREKHVIEEYDKINRRRRGYPGKLVNSMDWDQ